MSSCDGFPADESESGSLVGGLGLKDTPILEAWAPTGGAGAVGGASFGALAPKPSIFKTEKSEEPMVDPLPEVASESLVAPDLVLIAPLVDAEEYPVVESPGAAVVDHREEVDARGRTGRMDEDVS